MIKTFLPKEIIELLERITAMGDKKHGTETWLNPSNKSMQKEANWASIGRHQSKSKSGIKNDEESGEDHRGHAAWRLLHSYVRDERGIKDEPVEKPELH